MMRKKLLLAFGLAAGALPIATSYAASNPSGTGMPNQTCQIINATVTNPTGATGPFYPGNAPSAQGSVFAEPGGVFANGGTGGQQYNLVGAPSQYDVACYQMSQPEPVYCSTVANVSSLAGRGRATARTRSSFLVSA